MRVLNRQRLAACLLSALLVSATFAVALAAPAAAAPVACAEVPYTPGSSIHSSNYGAHTVRADGTSCATARRLALRAKSRRAFRFLGFSCTYRGTVARKPWRCYRPRPRAIVTFITIGN